MQFSIKKLNISPENFLRQSGYVEISNPHKNNETSYARSLDPGRFYPRFHVYMEKQDSRTMINLHLDAKKPSYEGTSAHSGEYDGKIVEQEMKRLEKNSEKFILTDKNQTLGFQSKKTFWQKIKDYLK